MTRTFAGFALGALAEERGPGKDDDMTTSRSRISATIACIALAGAGLVGAATPAQASDVYSWTGAGDGYNWSDSANWSPEGVPSTQNDSVIISGDVDVTVDRNVDIFRVTLQEGASLYDASTTLTTTQFEMAGAATLEAPIKTGSFAATGTGTKTIGSRGRVDATGARSGEWGQASITGGTLYIEASGTALKARVLSVSARIDGRGSVLPTIEVQDTSCPDPSVTCGVIVGVNYDGRGVGIDGVTLVASNIYFGQSATLSLREGLWKPRSGGRVYAATGSAGVLETGGPYPVDETGSPDQDVTLPSDVIFDGVTWRHVSGAIAGNGTLSPGTSSGTLEWAGGSITGRLQARRIGNVGVSVVMDAPGDEPLELKGPARGGGSLTLESGGSIGTGTTLMLDAVSSLINRSPDAVPFAQRPGSTITAITSSSTSTKVTNSGRWVVDKDSTTVTVAAQPRSAEPAVIEYVPFTSTGTLVLEAGGVLRLDGQRDNSLSGRTTVNVISPDEHGRIDVADGSTLKLGGALEGAAMSPASVTSGDELLIVDSLADESGAAGVSGGFAPITGTGLAPGLGFSGELIDTGYVLAVGAPEELTLTGKALARVKAKRALTIDYTVTNRAAIAVSPQLNLPILRNAKLTTPVGLTCAATGSTMVCELAEIAAGAQTQVQVSYTFGKPGRQTITTTVTSAGYNPNPAGARSTLTVTVTR